MPCSEQPAGDMHQILKNGGKKLSSAGTNSTKATHQSFGPFPLNEILFLQKISSSLSAESLPRWLVPITFQVSSSDVPISSESSVLVSTYSDYLAMWFRSVYPSSCFFAFSWLVFPFSDFLVLLFLETYLLVLLLLRRIIQRDPQILRYLHPFSLSSSYYLPHSYVRVWDIPLPVSSMCKFGRGSHKEASFF